MLLERDQELILLRGLLADAVRGCGNVVAISGEAGVGKTALMHALADNPPENVRVLAGACEDLVVPDPLGPLHDLARAVGWDLDRAIAQHDRRLPVFYEALEAFSGEHATLLTIEDLHWADDATLDFVRFVGRRVRDSRTLLLVTARSDETGGQARLRRALADIPSGIVTRIDLPALTVTAVGRLARDSGMDSAALFGASGGNPFFLTELLRAGTTVPPPPSVRDAVLARADRLPEAGRRALYATAIFPRRAEADALAALCGSDTAAGAEACAAGGLLIHTEDGVSFRHELARQAVETALPLPVRRDLNARALAFLRERGDVPVARLLHHAQEAGDVETVRALAPEAARQAAGVEAHREAAAHYATVLADADAYPPTLRADLYEAAAFEFQLTGALDAAVQAQASALELFRAAGDRLREGDGLRRLSRIAYAAGDRASAEVHARRSAELLAGHTGPELAMALSTLSQMAMLASDSDDALVYGERALALAEDLERPDVVSHALNNLGFARVWSDPDTGMRLLDRSLEVALDGGFSDHVARAYVNRACFAFETLDGARMHAELEAGISYCREHDIDYLRLYMQGWKAELLMREGDWDEAEAEARTVLDGHYGRILASYPSMVVLARLHSRRGRDDPEPLLADLKGYLETGKELQRFAPYAAIVAERAWLGQGDQAEARRLLLDASSMARGRAMYPEIVYWLRQLAPEEALPDTNALPRPWHLLFIGEWQASADAWAKVGAPFEQARALLEGGSEARLEALALFESLGAEAVALRVRELLRQQGIPIGRSRPRATTRANPAGLTRREMDVLRLLNDGRSNQEIADRLFVSLKTVDHHVSAILSKLDARSRSEAAAVARRSGLLEGEEPASP
jgi:DNA-binding CsgD family transcriptional regulator/predicted ATPase